VFFIIHEPATRKGKQAVIGIPVGRRVCVASVSLGEQYHGRDDDLRLLIDTSVIVAWLTNRKFPTELRHLRKGSLNKRFIVEGSKAFHHVA
jgi:hypothetical protein